MLFNREEKASTSELKHTTLATSGLKRNLSNGPVFASPNLTPICSSFGYITWTTNSIGAAADVLIRGEQR
jgi:hypothetical protein